MHENVKNNKTEDTKIQTKKSEPEEVKPKTSGYEQKTRSHCYPFYGYCANAPSAIRYCSSENVDSKHTLY